MNYGEHLISSVNRNLFLDRLMKDFKDEFYVINLLTQSIRLFRDENDKHKEFVENRKQFFLKNPNVFKDGYFKGCDLTVDYGIGGDVGSDIYFELYENKTSVALFEAIYNDDVDFVAKKVSEYPNIYFQLNGISRHSKEVALEAVKGNIENYNFLSDDLKCNKDVLNSMRDYLMNNAWSDLDKEDRGIFKEAKETLLQYDREDELSKKLADLDKLQAQQQNSNHQPKAEVKARRKI